MIEKPSASSTMKVPTSDSGMATVGISDERSEPRNRNTTTVTITSASTRVRITSLIALFTNSVEVVDDFAVEPLRQLRLDIGKDLAARP